MNYKNSLLNKYETNNIFELPIDSYYLKNDYKIPYNLDTKYLMNDYNYRVLVANCFKQLILNEEVDVFIGVATAGIPLAIHLSNMFKNEFYYFDIRKNLLIGTNNLSNLKNKKIFVLDNSVLTGNSFKKTLIFFKKNNFKICKFLTIYNYNLYNHKLITSILDYNDLKHYFSKKINNIQKKILFEFDKDPKNWVKKYKSQKCRNL